MWIWYFLQRFEAITLNNGNGWTPSYLSSMPRAQMFKWVPHGFVQSNNSSALFTTDLQPYIMDNTAKCIVFNIWHVNQKICNTRSQQNCKTSSYLQVANMSKFALILAVWCYNCSEKHNGWYLDLFKLNFFFLYYLQNSIPLKASTPWMNTWNHVANRVWNNSKHVL